MSERMKSTKREPQTASWMWLLFAAIALLQGCDGSVDRSSDRSTRYDEAEILSNSDSVISSALGAEIRAQEAFLIPDVSKGEALLVIAALRYAKHGYFADLDRVMADIKEYKKKYEVERILNEEFYFLLIQAEKKRFEGELEEAQVLATSLSGGDYNEFLKIAAGYRACYFSAMLGEHEDCIRVLGTLANEAPVNNKYLDEFMRHYLYSMIQIARKSGCRESERVLLPYAEDVISGGLDQYGAEVVSLESVFANICGG